MESFFGGSPWDFGTGFGGATGMGGTQPLATPPQTDLASGLASAFASQGIRPDQFMANPQAAAAAVAPPGVAATGGGGAGANPWDPTPVATPGGPAVSIPGQPPNGAPANPNIQTDASNPADANAAAAPVDKTAAGGSFGDKLAATLKGVKAPTMPTPQKVTSPAAPHPLASIKGGQLMALLQAISPQANQVAVPLSLKRSI